MDIEYEFGQSVMLVPRGFEYLNVVTGEMRRTKNAILGMGMAADSHPMLADGFNDAGLACAGLNFPNYTKYAANPAENAIDIPPYDVITWVLGNFDSVRELRPALDKLNIVGEPFNENLPLPTLHWIVYDKSGDCIVLERTEAGLSVFDNDVGVLTNSPGFDWHTTNLNGYIGLDPKQPGETRWGRQKLRPEGQGLGLRGMPGDFYPASRFVRAAFLRNHAASIETEERTLAEFFHLLANVAMPAGAVVTPEGRNDITLYAACMSLERGVYYYTTYNNNRINAISMKKEDLDGGEIKFFEYRDKQSVDFQN